MNGEMILANEPVQPQSMTVPQVQNHVQLIHQTMQATMKPNVHYGKIPGCPKPTLYKPGAEMLNLLFKLAPHYEEIDCNESDELISYRIRCTLKTQSGNTIATGLGTCNTKEKKYDKSLKKTGSLTWELQNTIYKMACKRALVAATLNSTAASDIFTQDIEDMPRETFQSTDPSAPICENCNIPMRASQYPSKKPGHKNYYCGECKYKLSLPLTREPGQEG
jgi:hypothetical protein